MKILLISDTHGNITRALEVAKHIKDINMIFHCGDLKEDAEDIMSELDIPVAFVPGNCDTPDTPYHNIVNTPAGKILITHGHKESVNYDINRLFYLAQSEDCIAACFGHTHVPFCEEYDGIYLVNPGSLSRPRDGSNGSFALLESTSDGFTAQIIYYDDFKKEAEKDLTKKKKKVEGGYLRRLLNYSDRF